MVTAKIINFIYIVYYFDIFYLFLCLYVYFVYICDKQKQSIMKQVFKEIAIMTVISIFCSSFIHLMCIINDEPFNIIFYLFSTGVLLSIYLFVKCIFMPFIEWIESL